MNFILTGRNTFEQVRNKRCCVDIIDHLCVDFKIGFLTVLLVSAAGAIAGSLVRRVYVRIIIAATISYGSRFALNSNCLNRTCNNLIEEAKYHIKQTQEISEVSDIITKNHVSTLNNIMLHLDYSEFICNLIENLAEVARKKTFYAAILVSFGFETVFFLFCYFSFSLLPLVKYMIPVEIARIIVLHLVGGYGSLFLAAFCGIIGFSTLPNPALMFFWIVFGTGLGLRYVLTITVGMLFDLVTGFHHGRLWCNCECTCCYCCSTLFKYCIDKTKIRCVITICIWFFCRCRCYFTYNILFSGLRFCQFDKVMWSSLITDLTREYGVVFGNSRFDYKILTYYFILHASELILFGFGRKYSTVDNIRAIHTLFQILKSK